MSCVNKEGKSEPRLQRLLMSSLPLWVLGMLFVTSAAVIGQAGLKMALSDWDWSRGVTTTGRVIATEWKKENQEDRLVVIYGYRDERGVIYHNTAILARRLGKINLEPGIPVVVLYRREDHSRSHMQQELGLREWIPIVSIAGLELLAGSVFLVAAARKAGRRRAETVS